MAEKLKSISNQIPWSLALKALGAGAVWLFLPAPVFFAVALWIYFVPLFKPLDLIIPYGALLGFAAHTSAPAGALFVVAGMFLIIGIKDLHFVARPRAYEALIIFFYFALGFALFIETEGLMTAPFWPAALGALLFGNYAHYRLRFEGVRDATRPVLLGVGLWGLLAWQFGEVLVLLPLLPFRAMALYVGGLIMVTEVLFAGLSGTLRRRGIILVFSAFFALATLILAATEWQI